LQQFAQPAAAAADLHAGCGETLKQAVGTAEQPHLMFPRHMQAVVEQHALQSVETAAAEQVHDALWRVPCCGPLAAQCRIHGRRPVLCGSVWSGSSASMVMSTGRPSCSPT